MDGCWTDVKCCECYELTFLDKSVDGEGNVCDERTNSETKIDAMMEQLNEAVAIMKQEEAVVNYQRLLAVKNAYDPNGLFVCHHCVGSERWTVESSLNCEHADQEELWHNLVCLALIFQLL